MAVRPDSPQAPCSWSQGEWSSASTIPRNHTNKMATKFLMWTFSEEKMDHDIDIHDMDT